VRHLRMKSAPVLGLTAALLLAGWQAAGSHETTKAAHVDSPTMTANPVVLSAANLPPKASIFRGQGNTWKVHGVNDNAAYLFTSTDPTHVFSAGAPRADWTGLAAANSWTISCATVSPSVRCAVEAPQNSAAHGLAMIGTFICEMSSTPGQGDYVAMPDGRACIAVNDPEGARAELNAVYGINQAVQLRNWMMRTAENRK